MCKHILIRDYNSDTDIDLISDFAVKTHDDDGFGAILRYRDGTIDTLKSLKQSDFYIRLMRKLYLNDVLELVVHHRTSTNGQGIEYAHPFEFQGNFLTHNGVVNVPGKHETKTTNDTEALLHHLIKTNYETESISGYFSCFILNQESTTVLVDDQAPIFTDGRIFSSHKLSEEMTALELSKIIIPLSGKERTQESIKVTKTLYGQDQAHLSLGRGKYSWSDSIDYSWERPALSPEESENASQGFKDYWVEKPVDTFFDFLTPREESMITSCRSLREAKSMIKRFAHEMELNISNRDIKEILKYLYRFD